MFYTYISPNGEIYFSEPHETMEEAYQEAVSMYGPGVVIRETWYGEWDCGYYKPGDRCGYDKYGKHITAEEAANV